MKYLVTGASGFLGRAVANKIESEDLYVASRSRSGLNCSKEYIIDLLEISPSIDELPLKNIDIIIHCASLAHVSEGKKSNLQEEFYRVNTIATVNLAKKAASNKVKRFIYISSIGVNGKSSRKPFQESDEPNPFNNYTMSKYNAEKGLLDIAKRTGMDVVIIRPPLVYGPLAKGNFGAIIKLVKKGWPLPFGSIKNNKRSFVAIDNLVSFILLCSDIMKTPQASGHTFVISDGEDISTAEFFNRIAKAYGKRKLLFPFPAFLLLMGVKLLGRQDMANSLFGTLQVDSSKASDLLSWKAIISMEEQLSRVVEIDI